MNRADSRPREHRARRLGNERQVDRDTVTALHAEAFQDVGELLNFDVQVPIRERATIPRLAFPDDRGLVAPRRVDVPVDAIEGDIDLPSDEPLGTGRCPLEHFVPLRVPVELLCLTRPEARWVARSLGINRRIGDDCVPPELVAGRELSVLLEKDVDVGHTGGWWLVAGGWWIVSVGSARSKARRVTVVSARYLACMSHASISGPTPVLEATGLVRAFGSRRAVDGVDVSVGAGDCLVLFGPNGAGKTTLLRLLAGLLKPTAGATRIDGALLRGDSAARAAVGLISHQTMLYGALTARENLEFTARLYGEADPSSVGERALRTMRVFDRADTPVRVLSRGLQQRVSIG